MALTAKEVYAILKRQISDMEAKLNSPVRYRGTVATADLLPLNPDIGDMYNIESKSIYGEAGMNVAWNGVVWDTMGASIDMSLYFTKEEANTTIQNMVNEYLEKNPVKPGATTEQAQQIEQNKKDVASLKTETGSLKEDITSKADKTSLVKTDRKLDALWKLNQGISYEFQTDEAEAYQKTVPSGAKLAIVKSIGGKTIVWNQLVKKLEDNSSSGITVTLNNDMSMTISGTPNGENEWVSICAFDNIKNDKLVMNHKYLVRGLTKLSEMKKYGFYLESGMDYLDRTKDKIIFTCDKNINDTLYCVLDNGREYNFTIKPQFFDLTQMFGAGNEPSTPEEFEAMFPADYYPYNAGELMSAPVNEVIEQGKNYFDFSRLVSDGVNVMDYDNQTITVPARTNNTGYNQTLRDLCPEITPGTYVFSMKRSNPNSIQGSYFLEAAKDFRENIPTELTDELLNNHIAWYNNPDSNIENVISEIQIEKNSAKTLYSQYYQKSHKIPQAILNLDGYGESGNFVDFAQKKYHKGDRAIDISDIIGGTFQEPLEVEAGGTLTFKNSHGDNYRIPVPSSEEYVISLAEVAK